MSKENIKKKLIKAIEKELGLFLESKFTGILARKKWDKDDIQDIIDELTEIIRITY